MELYDKNGNRVYLYRFNDYDDHEVWCSLKEISLDDLRELSKLFGRNMHYEKAKELGLLDLYWDYDG